MKKILNVAFILASIGYPIALYFLGNVPQITLFMAALWLAKFFVARQIYMLIIALLFCAMGLESVKFLAYFYPSLINVFLCAFFILSLKKECVITKIARAKHGQLSAFHINYTRKLCALWGIFFMMNACIAFILAMLEDKIYWSIFCGIIIYVLVGAFFGLEYGFRLIYFRRKHAD